MTRTAGALLLLVPLGALLIVGCGESPPPSPSTPPVPAPDQEEGTAEPPSTSGVATPDEEQVTAKKDGFVPPQNWCGTGRVEYGRVGGWERGEDRMPRPERIQRLIKRLQDKDPKVVRAAAAELRRLNAKNAVPALIRILESHEDELARFEAAQALRTMCTPDVIPHLIEALSDKNCLVRIVTWDALASEARLLREATPDDEGDDEEDDGEEYESGRDIRRLLLDAVQEDIQLKWQAWWRENEVAFRKKWTSRDKLYGLRK